MLTYSELVELREKLVDGNLDVSSAKSLFWNDYKSGQRSWNTADWKERRLKFLKKACEICGENDKLTIQHLSHPKSYAEYLREITRRHTDKFIRITSTFDKNEFLRLVSKKYDYIPVPLCPNCKAKNPTVRVRKTPVHRCAGCKHEFDHAIFITAEELISIFYTNEDAYEVQNRCFVSKDNWRNQNNLASVRYWLKSDLAKNSNSETIEKEAFLLHLNDCIKYLSFEDAITACGKCAYNHDIKRMEICPKCNQNYKGFEYSTCIECLPEDKRKVAYESIQFGIQWNNMHKELGID